MFFVVFWGRRWRTDNWGLVAPAQCPRCHRDVHFNHLVTDSTSHVFFIPLSHTTTHTLACPSCGFAIDLSDQLNIAVSGMSATRTRWEGGMLSDDEYAEEVAQFWDSMGSLDDYRGPKAIDGTGALARGQSAEGTPSGWLADPTGRHDLRFFDGTWWTAYVLDDGQTSTDTFLTPRGPGWYPDAHRRHELRYWDGRAWTDQIQDGGVLAVDPV